MSAKAPIYSHNPYHTTKFPLLVLNVNRHICTPSNEGFQVLHWHDEVQLVYILKGIVHVKIYDEEFDLRQHDCIFINRTVLHHVTGKEDYHYHSYIIPARMLSFFPGSVMEKEDVEAIINNPIFTHYVLRSNNPAHNSVLHNIRTLDALYFQENKHKHHEYRLSIQLAMVWFEFLFILPAIDEVEPARDYERIRILISMIHTNYYRHISIQDIADAAHISKTECVRCFQKFVHDSPYQYLLKYRLHISTSLLITTDKSITDIAFTVGFRSASSYIRYFKLHYHMTPYKYRTENMPSG
jgi:AraC-like DNA-binding protein